MKKRANPVRSILYAGAGLAALALFLHLYFAIPRALGDVGFDSVRWVSADAIDRLHDDLLETPPRRWLRVELSAETDLTARTMAVGGTDDLYAGSSFCPFLEPVSNQGEGHLMTHGPFPDDLPRLLPGAGDTRHAVRRADGRFHYTIYVDADRPGEARDLCVKIKGSASFSPHAESRVVRIPGSALRDSSPSAEPQRSED